MSTTIWKIMIIFIIVGLQSGNLSQKIDMIWLTRATEDPGAPIIQLFWGRLGHFWGIWGAFLGPIWGIFGGLFWDIWGPFRGLIFAFWGSILGLFGGPFCSIFGGPILGHFWLVNFRGPFWGPLRLFLSASASSSLSSSPSP